MNAEDIDLALREPRPVPMVSLRAMRDYAAEHRQSMRDAFPKNTSGEPYCPTCEQVIPEPHFQCEPCDQRVSVTVSTDRRAWEALLRPLPRWVECPALAEIRLDGLPRCCNCAAKHRRGRFVTLEHADAMGAILDALSPFTPAGKWEGGVDG